MLMKTVQLPGAEVYDSNMVMHASKVNTDTRLAREFQNIFKTQHEHMACWITLMTENMRVNGSGLSVSSTSKTENMFHTHQLKCHVIQLSY